MNEDGNHIREAALRERIARLMRSNEQARRKPMTGEEREKLKSAAGRLDRLLQAADESDRQSLKSAASRLDQLLADIRQGKDVTQKLQRRRDRQEQEERS